MLEPAAEFSNKWFGAYCEPGGSFGMHGELARIKPARPAIEFRDNNQKRSDKLAALLGLPEAKPYGQNWKVLVRGYDGANLLLSVRGHAPSLSPLIDCVERWQDASTTREKNEIAATLRGWDRMASLDEEDRKRLLCEYYIRVQDPQWLAGVIDHRALSVHTEFPFIHLQTTNVLLIEAIHFVHGGGYHIKPAGREAIIEGKHCITRHDSAIWYKHGQGAKEFVNTVLPYLLIRGDEFGSLVR